MSIAITVSPAIPISISVIFFPFNAFPAISLMHSGTLVESTDVPRVNFPNLLLPHVYTFPLPSIAITVNPSVSISFIFFPFNAFPTISLMHIGTLLSSYVPFPNFPPPLLPHVYTFPSLSSAITVFPLVTISFIFFPFNAFPTISLMHRGSKPNSIFVPFPNCP